MMMMMSTPAKVTREHPGWVPSQQDMLTVDWVIVE